MSAGTAREFAIGGLVLLLVPDSTEVVSSQVGVPDVEAAHTLLTSTTERFPTAARTLAGLLELTSHSAVADGLTAESLAYSTLMSGCEYRRWLRDRTRREVPDPLAPVVLLDRDDNVLTVTLNHPERHNAFGRRMRDGLCEAFDLVAADDSITTVVVRGNGRSFCSGGDLDEFGTTPDLACAHLIRQDRSVAARIHAVRDRVTVRLHGSCIGAGIELASFAGRVIADASTTIRLPELTMGLIPGAGGTVGITSRIGPWRTAYLALSGTPLPLDTALRWGLVDELDR